ncbi:hypothetical protein K491DRAFT_612001 [Lophiostoma macrostomum CBS 122681]|uniref:GPI anchored protein n=1 Tax=Lophiostoma macrostomum CBS 122681 TaxID=1314788 RepID=A0A6A6SMG9_9PLEO|nr:hypothetical protein K491DRAFT_612001 [Lophiostoma macrostomum CBS 122681]
MVRISSSVLLFSAVLGASASPSQNASDISAHSRVLRAATRNSDLFRRSMRIEKKFGTELSYIEKENSWGNGETFSSRLKLSSKTPVLNLEEIEHHLVDVQCSDGAMKLHFVDSSSARDATHACSNGAIITSHQGCNAEGERAVYRVNAFDYPEDDSTLELSVEQSTWKAAFSNLDIDFGYTNDHHFYRRHADFSRVRRRQAATSVSVGSVPIPTDVPQNQTATSFDLNLDFSNKTFDPSELLGNFTNVVSIPDLPVEVTCTTCSTKGTIEISQGEIQIDMSQIDLIPDALEGGDDGKDLLNVITGGFFQLTANGVGAHIELAITPKVNGKYAFQLPGFPLLGFEIPGIGKADVLFNHSIEVNFVAEGGLTLGYGFDVAVPDNSNVRVELSDLTSSNVVGFPNATLTPLPFSANVTDIDLVVGLGYKPSIPIGFEFLDQIKASVGVQMDLPRLDAHLTTKGNVAPDCTPLGGNSTNSTNSTNSPLLSSSSPFLPSADLPGLLSELGPLVVASANITLSVDLTADFKFPALPDIANSFNTAANLFATTIELGTTCLAAESSYATATEVWSSLTSSIIASNSAAATATGTGNISISASLGNAQETDPAEFTGAATPGSYAPSYGATGLGWQFAVLGVSVVFGVMIML